ncbi:ABC transporter substrate-binding protein [Aquisalimonas lutea]|uniref:ABC transporter substrate-binding protein n=1 Tax=Aquisalimonas lutea TaxID=1327750 RepID=UPI0025B35824|nr:ABC transporter substrate-binding protein [Aquisalimonas lutea]MDN3519799.1 ABC transporter substrate-binding protein [Aquisalimonas lutea]
MSIKTAIAKGALVTLVAQISFGQVVQASEGETVSFDYGIPSGFYASLYVAEDLGLFDKYGLDPNFHHFDSGAPLLAGLESESLDVVTTGLASVFAIGKGIPITYIMWEGDAAQAEGIIARNGVGMESIEDLGRIDAIGAPTGTCAQISLYHAADHAGVDYNDLNRVNVAPPMYANAFHSASLDAGVSWSPYLISMKQDGHDLVGLDPEWMPEGGACPEMTMARTPFLEENPEVARRLVRINAEARAAIAEDPSLALDAVKRRLSLNDDVAREVFELYEFPSFEQQLDADSRYSLVGEKGVVAQLKVAADTFEELGVISETLSVETLSDAVEPRYVQEYAND